MAFETLSQDEARLHLIAHAPQTIPDWFDPTMPEEPKKMVRPFDKFSENSQAINDWANKKLVERVIQWPIFWADQILSKLNA